jgi:hypothetical protein
MLMEGTGSTTTRLLNAALFTLALAGGIALVLASLRSVGQVSGPAAKIIVHPDERLVLGTLLCVQAGLSLHLYFRGWAAACRPGRC